MQPSTEIEHVGSNILLLRNPLPIPALRHVNTYILLSDSSVCIVDPGLGEESARNIRMVLNRLGRTSVEAVVVTHFHVDHSTASAFIESPVFIGARDWDWITRMVTEWPEPVKAVEKLFVEHGMPASEAAQLEAKHPAFSRIRLFSLMVERVEAHTISDSDKIELCGRRYRVLSVPGHTPGHIALHGENHVFVGDHVLDDITPNIALLWWELNPLQDYLESLGRVAATKATLLPGHRRLITNAYGRARELLQHHVRRLCEIIDILAFHGPQTAYEVAKKMSWDVPFRSWEEYPVAQKFFAHAEALSHLKFLNSVGVVDVIEDSGRVTFRLANRDCKAAKEEAQKLFEKGLKRGIREAY